MPTPLQVIDMHGNSPFTHSYFVSVELTPKSPPGDRFKNGEHFDTYSSILSQFVRPQYLRQNIAPEYLLPTPANVALAALPAGRRAATPSVSR